MTDDKFALPTSRVLGPPADYPFDDVYGGEDEYPAIHDEDIAYAIVDQDSLDPDLIARHDELVELPLARALEIDVERLNDLHRWAVARVFVRHGELDAYVRVCRKILETSLPDRGPWLSYPDIALELARKLATLRRFDEAYEALHRYRAEEKANPREYARYHGIITLQAGDRDTALSQLLEAIQTHELDDPEFALHLGDELATMGLAESIDVYQAGIAVARRRHLADLLAELEDALDAATHQLQNP